MTAEPGKDRASRDRETVGPVEVAYVQGRRRWRCAAEHDVDVTVGSADEDVVETIAVDVSFGRNPGTDGCVGCPVDLKAFGSADGRNSDRRAETAPGSVEDIDR